MNKFSVLLCLSVVANVSLCLADGNECPINFDKLPAMGWIPSPDDDRDPSIESRSITIRMKEKYRFELPYKQSKWQFLSKEIDNSVAVLIESGSLIDKAVILPNIQYFVFEGRQCGQVVLFLKNNNPWNESGALTLMLIITVVE